MVGCDTDCMRQGLISPILGEFGQRNGEVHEWSDSVSQFRTPRPRMRGREGGCCLDTGRETSHAYQLTCRFNVGRGRAYTYIYIYYVSTAFTRIVDCGMWIADVLRNRS